MSKKSFALLVVLVALFGSAACFQENHPADGNTALGQLQRMSPDIYVTLFYHADATNVDHYRSEIKAFMERCQSSNVYYSEVDIDNNGYDPLVKTLKISDLSAKYPNDRNPTVFSMKSGEGAWSHGPLALDKMREYFAKLCS